MLNSKDVRKPRSPRSHRAGTRGARPTPATAAVIQPPSPPSRQGPMQAWFMHHLYVLFSSLGQLSRQPLPTLLTASVIGIALALPAGLYLLLENAQQISQHWDGSVQMSLFLKTEVEDAQAQQLADELRGHTGIATVELITRAQALEEYRRLSGFSDALSALDDNPLPAVLVVTPKQSDPQSSQAVLEQLSQLPAVDIAQFDMRWLKRLFAIMDMVRRGILILSSLLALAVLLVIGNTIRLAIHNRREEIEITRLFGATDAFIRRPFLYAGIWYGLFGSLLAWVLVKIAFAQLQTPVQTLTRLYHSDYSLVTLSLNDSLLLLLAGAGLGLAGAWLAVGQHLQAIRPR